MKAPACQFPNQVKRQQGNWQEGTCKRKTLFSVLISNSWIKTKKSPVCKQWSHTYFLDISIWNFLQSFHTPFCMNEFTLKLMHISAFFLLLSIYYVIIIDITCIWRLMTFHANKCPGATLHQGICSHKLIIIIDLTSWKSIYLHFPVTCENNIPEN